MGEVGPAGKQKTPALFREGAASLPQRPPLIRPVARGPRVPIVGLLESLLIFLKGRYKSIFLNKRSSDF